jgi:hypothetical protein
VRFRIRTRLAGQMWKGAVCEYQCLLFYGAVGKILLLSSS